MAETTSLTPVAALAATSAAKGWHRGRAALGSGVAPGTTALSWHCAGGLRFAGGLSLSHSGYRIAVDLMHEYVHIHI